ncbi:MAG: Gfo/Idh/MocA family oxidoreductase [Promethearchaeota archaeon]
MPSVKVGLVGLGFVGRVHLANLLADDRVQLVVCSLSVDEKKVPAGIPFYDDFEAMLANETLDGVVIATPTPLHEPMAVEATRRGVHAFVEKPLALDLPGCDRIVDAARKTGAYLQVGHVLHFWPSYVEARRRVREGDLGRPRQLRAIRAGPFPGWAAWFADDAQSGSVILDLNIHDVDFAAWLFDEPVAEVYAEAREIEVHGRRVWGVAHTSLRFESGGLALCEASWAGAATMPFTTKLEVACEKGLLSFEPRPCLSLYGAEEAKHLDPVQLDGYALELRHFVDLLTGKATEPAVTGEFSREVVRVCLAARKSAREHRVVRPREEVP